MAELHLQKVIYKKINSFIEIKQAIQLQMSNTISLNVNYEKDNKKCFAFIANKTIAIDHSDEFSIDLELVGIFDCDGINSNEDKREAHVQIYNLLFPYLQSMIADLSSKAGLPPLMINSANINANEIQIDE